MWQDQQSDAFEPLRRERAVDISFDLEITRRERIGCKLIAGSNRIFRLDLPRTITRRGPALAVPFVEEHAYSFGRFVIHGDPVPEFSAEIRTRHPRDRLK